MRKCTLAAYRSLFGLLMVSLCLPVGAQVAPKEAVDPLADNPHLTQKVKISVEGLPVGDVLALLSQKTGVTLTASRDVADEKVILFGPSRSMREVLTDLAALLNEMWLHEKTDDGKDRYTLTRDFRARQIEESLSREVTQRLMAQLDAQVRALSETADQLAERPENDPIRKNLTATALHGRRATQLYALLSREQKRTLFAQGYLNVSFAESTPDQQKAVRAAFNEVTGKLKEIDEAHQQENTGVRVVLDAPENLERYGIRFNLHHENNPGLSAQVVQIILGRFSYMTMGSFDSGSQWLLPAHGNPYTRKDVPKDAPLPAPEAARAAASAKAWIDRLHKLAEVSGLPIMADTYRSPAILNPMTQQDPVSEDTSIAALDALCKPVGYLWWMTQDKTLFLRKRDWVDQRRYEVPDRWTLDMIRRLETHQGVATYGDVARLLDLTPAQIAGLNNSQDTEGRTPYDEDKLAGLPELLTMARASTSRATPLFVGTPSPDERKQNALPFGGTAMRFRSNITAFLIAQRLPAAPADIAAFRSCFSCYKPVLKDEPENKKAQPVHIVIEWGTSEGQTPYDRQIQLLLPAELPNDRRDKTKIALEP